LSLAFAVLPIVSGFCPIWGMSAARVGLTSGPSSACLISSIIVYEIDEAAQEVAIIAVFHGAQDRDDGT